MSNKNDFILIAHFISITNQIFNLQHHFKWLTQRTKSKIFGST